MENIYKKMAEPAAGTDNRPEAIPKWGAAQYIPPGVAHDLNNIIAIIRGYADRLLSKHGENPALEPQLKLISDAAKRAGTIVRNAMPPHPDSAPPDPLPPPQPAA